MIGEKVSKFLFTATKLGKTANRLQCSCISPYRATAKSANFDYSNKFKQYHCGTKSGLPSSSMYSNQSQIWFKRSYSDKSGMPPKQKKSTYRGSLISWSSVLVLVGVGTAGVIALRVMTKEKDKNLAARRQVAIGKPDLGGDWILIDHHGNKRTNKDFLGQWVILYFGFSFCPDICPEEMEKLVQAVDRIDDDPSIPNVVPIFITLDPERDTPVHLAKYISEFSPKVIGMTGSSQQIAHAAKAYRIYYSAGAKDEDNDYIVDHSIIKYLISPDGEFAEYFGQNKTASDIYNQCKRHMKEWRKEHSLVKITSS